MTSIHVPNARILILGIGNLLMGDEGLGVHLAQRLQNGKRPPGVDVVDGGTGGFHLMEFFESYDAIIMVDATLDERPPGTIRLIEPRYAADFPRAMSTHDIGLKDLVSGLQALGRLPKIYLFAVSVAELQHMQLELSPHLETIMPVLMKRVLKLGEDLAAERPPNAGQAKYPDKKYRVTNL